jgi:exodeoxyribonuclease-3
VNLRLLTYNIRSGGVGREDALAATIRTAAPDLVVLQEANRPSVVKQLAAATGMTSWGSTRGHSVGFMSRVEVAGHAWRRPRPCRRAFLEILLKGSGLRIFGVHLSAAHSHWVERHRMREMEAVLVAIGGTERGLHLLAGDFNTLAPGETLDLSRLPHHLRLLARIGGRTIRWQTIQIMLDAGYLDGFRIRHPQEGGSTFPTWDPNLRIDYVFVPGDQAARLVRCEVWTAPPARQASDHFPVLVDLELEPFAERR